MHNVMLYMGKNSVNKVTLDLVWKSAGTYARPAAVALESMDDGIGLNHIVL